MKIFIIHSCEWTKLCIFFLFFTSVVYSYAQNTLAEEKLHGTTGETVSRKNENNAESSADEKNTKTSTGVVIQSSETEESFPILEDNVQDTTAIEPIGLWDTARVFIVLAFVIVGIYALVWGLKKFQSRAFTRSETINVLASRQLSGGGNVHLVKLGKSLFFIGASNQNVTLMKEIQEKEEVDEIDLSLSIVENENESKGNSFYGKIEHLFKKSRDSNSVSQRKNSYKNNTIHTTFEIIKSMFGKQVQRGKKLDA